RARPRGRRSARRRRGLAWGGGYPHVWGMEPDTALSAGGIIWRLSIALFLVLANAFFVAAEFALVGARRTRIESLAEEGNTRARLARIAIGNLDHYITGTQLGITLASLGLGWVGESTLAAIIIQA